MWSQKELSIPGIKDDFSSLGIFMINSPIFPWIFNQDHLHKDFDKKLIQNSKISLESSGEKRRFMEPHAA